MVFQNGSECRRFNSADDHSTLCKNLVNFSTETLEITKVKILTFVTIGYSKIGISNQIFQSIVDRSYQNFKVDIDMWVGMTNLIFILRSLKRRCYGKQLFLGANNEHWLIPPSGPGPGPPSVRGPQTAQVLYFSSREFSVTNSNFHCLTQQISFSVDNHLQNDT